MTVPRREFLGLAGALAFVPLGSLIESNPGPAGGPMYGLIGKITAVAGQRDALADILLEGTRSMPGSLSYIVAADAADPDALWITEVWDSRDSHAASLSLPAVRAAIAKGRPLITGMSDRAETIPLGGHGLDQGGPTP